MIPVFINTQQISELFNVDAQSISNLKKTLLVAIVEDFERTWKRQADLNLGQTKKRYKRAIQKEYLDDSNAVVYLDPKDWVVNAVEAGIGAFDMKNPGFANSPKRHLKKDGGWYLTIPFRWATPDAIGESEAFSGKMPEPVYKAAKAVLPGSGRGLLLNEIPKEYQAPKVRPEVTGLPPEVAKAYTNKNSLYEGMIKSDKPNHSHYTTFRRVSDNSDANSWIHTGIKARNLSGKALAEFEGEFIETIVQNIVSDFLNGLV